MGRILIACEESQEVTFRFREQWLEAFSCDVVGTSGMHPEWHLQEDVLPLLKEEWDMVIAFPPCTHLCVSGTRYFKEKQEDGRQQKAIDFFMAFTEVDCEYVAIENPIGIMSTIYRKPDQIIEPWWFGDPVQKATCLWLKGLPPLLPTENGFKKMLQNNMGQSINNAAPSEDRAKIRSKTFPGVAKAMATQWGALLK